MDTSKEKTSTARVSTAPRMLTTEQFQKLADVPAVLEWLANTNNPGTRRAYKTNVTEFAAFVGIRRGAHFPRANLAWSC